MGHPLTGSLFERRAGVPMIFPGARAILDQAKIEVVRAVYAKELTTHVHGQPMCFGGGNVQLGEVDEWLQEYTARQSQPRIGHS
jgi:hypothetical protein